MRVRDVVKSLLITASGRIRPAWQLAHFLAENTDTPAARRAHPYAYPALRRQFIANGATSRFDSATRGEIVRRFEKIDRSVQSASSPTDGLFLAEAFLGLDAAGDAVECGCFQGASSSKLSILAALTERRLVIFDSFEGLPDVDTAESRDLHMQHGGSPEWWSGRYAGALDLVRSNIEKHGEVSVCTFVKGWFDETLPGPDLPEKVALAFVDVDLTSSAVQCLRAIWPRIPSGGVFFSHDAAFVKVLQAFQDPKLWYDVSEPAPPILFGAGFGLGSRSPHLGYFVKDCGVLPPEYLKRLTIHR